MKKNIGAIIQARMTSTRLPEKSLLNLCGKPLIERIVARIEKSNVNQIVIATTKRANDDVIEKFCRNKNISCFRGDEEDVLDRFYHAAKENGIDIIIRITADDPFKDRAVINKAIDIIVHGGYDYVSNTINPTYPEGIDVEAFTFEAIEKAWKEAMLPSEHEHVTPYIWKNTNIFRSFNFENDIDYSYMRWTVDTPEDFEFAKRIYQEFPEGEYFDMYDIIDLLRRKPEYLKINSGHIRNEGYLNSIKQEKEISDLYQYIHPKAM